MKQTTALQILKEGHNVFLTGQAGAGKSYTLRQFIEYLRMEDKTVGITASSGIAATILGGSTIHSYTNIGIKSGITATDIFLIRKKKPIVDRLKSLDVLILDEISMLHARQLNMVNYVLKAIRDDFRPFGGVQLVVAGDFCLKDGTCIIMADGTLRNIEDVQIGEYVMGPDSLPRKVLRLFKGTAQLYQVDQTHGKSYTVTGNHLLSLKHNITGELVVKKPLEYVETSIEFKNTYKGYNADTSKPLSTLTITPVEVGDFSGIEVDGDNLFLLEDCTVLHNCQLPPVGPEEPRDRFAFMSRSWLEAQFKICYLTEQYRQSDSDLNDILNAIRDGNVTSAHKTMLLDTVNNKLSNPTTKLYTHNSDVDFINTRELNKLQTEQRIYLAETTGKDADVAFLRNNVLSPAELTLKVDATVMFTKNDPDGRYVNGTIGKIVSFTKKKGSPFVLPEVRVVAPDGTEDIITAEKQAWEKVDDFGKAVASYNQIPLRLAWAITCHKCQGLTLSEAEMNLKGAFEYGQGYVALSRVRSLKGLRLLGMNDKSLQLDPLARKADTRFRVLSQELAEEYGET